MWSRVWWTRRCRYRSFDSRLVQGVFGLRLGSALAREVKIILRLGLKSLTSEWCLPVSRDLWDSWFLSLFDLLILSSPLRVPLIGLRRTDGEGIGWSSSGSVLGNNESEMAKINVGINNGMIRFEWCDLSPITSIIAVVHCPAGMWREYVFKIRSSYITVTKSVKNSLFLTVSANNDHRPTDLICFRLITHQSKVM